MKFRMRKRKRAATPKDVPERPPDVITVAATSDYPYDEVNESRWALQKVFASHLLKISRQHLNDSNRQPLGKRSSLADASTSGDSSTKDKPEEEQVSTSFAGVRAKNHSFQPACGGEEEAANSVMETKIIVEQNTPVTHRDNGVPKKRLKCMDLSSPLMECTSPRNDKSTKQTQGFPLCFTFGEGCMTSLFPDSYKHHDLKPSDAAEMAKSGVSETQSKIANFFLSTNAYFRKRPETKRNGIPKFITVVIPCKRQQGHMADSNCCGAIPLCGKEQPVQKQDPVDTVTSFDTSLQRLEESLKKANLDADVEEQHTWPMHEPRPGDPPQQDRTAENTSATSSISTHTSLKFGTSIVKLPPVMSPPL